MNHKPTSKPMTGINWHEKATKAKPHIRDFINGHYNETRGKNSLKKHSSRNSSLLYELGNGEAKDADQEVANPKETFTGSMVQVFA